jgi:hypothetical protein
VSFKYSGEGPGFVVPPPLEERTVELSFVRPAPAPINAGPSGHAADGTDPHPVTVEQLIGEIDSQLDTVWADSEKRGRLAGAEAFLTSVHELALLTQSLEGQATERVEMLRSTAAAALDADEDAYGELMDRIHGEVA